MANQIVFVPHGAGPMPLLGDPGHARLVSFFRKLGADLDRPKAVVVVSAHYENSPIRITSGAAPGMLFDYYGFPEAAYAFSYPAPGHPQLAKRICDALHSAGLAAELDAERGFDHGTFVPLILMYPDAGIPVVQLSLNADLDPARHLEIGHALGSLTDDGLLFLGSGLSFHNMQAFRHPTDATRQASEAFHDWLVEALSRGRTAELVQWAQAPGGRVSHPREEHLLPLHVCAGLAQQAGLDARINFDEVLLGHRTIGVVWG